MDGGGERCFWDDSSNWLDAANQNRVPAAADDVVINQTGVTVTIRSSSQSVNSIHGADALTISGGSLTLAAGFQLDGVLTLGAGTTLTTNGTLTLTGNDSWANATLAGSGAVNNQGTLALTGTGETLSTTLNNTGTITQSSAGTLSVNGMLNNLANGLFDIQAASLPSSTAIGGYGSVANAGTIRRSQAIDVAAITAPLVNQGGTLDAETGTLQITAGGAHTGGTINAQTGANVQLGGSFTGTYTGSGGGAFTLYNNILIGTGGATFDFAAGLFRWSSYNIDMDGNTLTNTGAMSITVNGNNFNGYSSLNSGTGNQGGTFDNQGTVLQPSGYFYLYDSVTIKNESTYNFTGNAGIYFGNYSPSFVNTSIGLLEKTHGTATSTVAVPFNNQGGTVNASVGTLSLAGGGASTGGTFNAQASATLDLTGGQTNTLGGSYTGSGQGTVSVANGTLAIAAAGATFNFPAGLFVWSGGTLSGSAGGALANTGALTLATGNEKDLNNGLVLNNSGTLLDNGSGYWQFYNHSIVNNLPGGLINLAKTEALTQFNGGSGTLINEAGATLENTGTGTTHGVLLNNLGVVDVESGHVTFNNVSQVAASKLTGGSWIVAGTGQLSLPGGNLTENDGAVTLSGGGIFSQINALAVNTGSFNLLGGASFITTGDLQNSGTITLSPASVLHAAGNLILSSTSTLTFQIGGTPASGQFGQFTVHNAAILAGTLNLVLLNGFGPLAGEVFQLASYGSTSGAFASTQGQTVNGVQLFSANANPTALVLTSLVDAADLTVASITVTPSALVGQPFTINYQVNNLKPLATQVNAWTDAIYLSADGTVDASSVLLRTIPHSGVVAANGFYTASATVPMPAVLPGSYHVVVVVDSGAAVPDSDRTNNVVASSGTVAIDYTSVSPGAPAAATIAAGQSRYYRLDVPVGSDLMLTAALPLAGAAQVFVSAGAIPTPTSYGQAATVAGSNLNLPLLDTGAGPYFVLVQGLSPAGAGVPLTLSMRQLGFEIVGVSPAVGPDSGSTTITISGSHFTATTAVSLASSHGTILTPTNTTFGNSNTLTATFDLDGVTPQFEDVKITDLGQTFTAPSAFQIVPNVVTVAGTLSANTEWLNGIVYHVTKTVEVAAGATLTIDPGTLVKFDAGMGLTIDSGATLSAIGTASLPIVFTSIKDDANGGDTNGNGNATAPAAGDWSQIFNQGQAAFDHVEVLYGSGVGNTGLTSGAVRNAGGTVTFADSLISQAFYDGLDTVGGSVAISNSTFLGADRAVVSTFGNSTITIVNSTFDNNRIAIFSHVGGSVSVTNSIISNSLQIGIDTDGGPIPISYSDVYSTVSGAVNYSGMTNATGGNGDISAAPKFVNAAAGDYRLNFLSPAIDAANTLAAPATDMDGNARYNDPRTPTKTGIANGNGAYADMGALEFVESAAATIDLRAVNVAGPAAALSGQTATITWTEENIGSGPAVGGWHDQINLVLNPGPNQSVIAAGTVLVAGGLTLGPNQPVNLSASVTVPGGVPGNYFWQVVPDATGDVFQGTNQGTGAGQATVTAALSLPALAINGAATGSAFTAPGQSFAYQVTPGSSADLLLTLNSPAATGDVELYAAQGYLPTPTNFQFKSQQFDVPNPTLVITAPQAGVPYFVVAYARTLTSASVAYTLAAATPQFAVSAVSPTALGNSGSATLQISGGQLAANDTYQLVGPGGAFTATLVQVQDSSTVAATFNLNGAAAGVYSLTVTPPTGPAATLSNAVQVNPAVAASLVTQVLVPTYFRPGRVFHGTVVYENTGNVDMPAPMLDLSTNGQAELSLDGTNFSTNDLQLIGVSFSGPTGVLRPGQSWSIPFEIMSSTTNTVPFQISYDLASDAAPVDYTALAAQVRPAGLSDSYWNAAFGQFQQQAGPTWGGVVSLLAQYTSAVAASGNPQIDSENMVFGYALQGSLQQAEASATGHVYLNDAGHPLAGVEVLLANAATGASGGVSNPDGSFIVDSLPAGTYNVTVEGYLLPNPVQVVIPAVGAATGLSIVANAGGSIAGSVVRATDGSALAGLTVQALNTIDHSTYQATTNAGGRYDLTGLTDGIYSLTVGGASWETQYVTNVPITSASTVPGLNFTLNAAATVTGKVLANGTPVAGAYVSLTDANGNAAATTTDSSGAYAFTGLSGGSYLEHVTAPTFAPSQATITVAAGATATSAAISLLPSDTLQVTLLGSSSLPLANGVVALTQNGAPVTTLATNAQGLATFTGLGDGSYQLEMTAPGFADSFDTLILSGGAIVARTYQLAVGCQINGTVTDGNGAAIGGIAVNLLGQDSAGAIVANVATTAHDGSYQFPRLPAGAYTITVGNDVGIDPQTATVSTAVPQATINIAIAGAVIQGSVVQADGATPIAHATVVLMQNGLVLADAQSGTNGTYTFRGLAAGTYSLLAATGQGLTAAVTVSVSGNNVTPASPLTLGNLSFCGVVQDAAGGPVAQATILLVPASDPTATDLPIFTTQADGTFTFTGLPAGQYTLEVLPVNDAVLITSVTVANAASAPQTFVVTPGIAVSGTITDAGTSQTLSQASIVFMDPSSHAVLGTAVTDNHGYFVAPHLPAGSYNVAVYGANYQIQELTNVAIESNPFVLNTALSAQTTTLTGVISDASGHPLPSVAVSIINALGETIAVLTTSVNGMYTTTQLAPGVYTVLAQLPGYHPSQITGVTLSSGGTVTRNVPLTTAGTDETYGVVYDPTTGGYDGIDPTSVEPTPVQAPTGPTKPQPDEGDPTVPGAEQPPQPLCKDAQLAYQQLVLAQHQVGTTYQNWLAAYDNYGTTSTVNTAIASVDIANTLASLTGDIAVGAVESGVQAALKTALKYGQTEIDVVNAAGTVSLKLANIVSAITTVFTYIKNNPFNPSESVADAQGFASGILGALNAIFQTSLGLSGMSRFIQLLNKSVVGKVASFFPGIGTISNILGTVGDILDNADKYGDAVDLTSQTESNYHGSLQHYLNLLEAYDTIQGQCSTSVTKSPGGTGSGGTKQQGGSGSSQGITGTDPNDLTTTGFGPQGFITPSTSVTYTIDFENKPTASGAAQQVIVTDALPASIDWSSVQLTSVGFNGITLAIAPGLHSYTATTTVSTDPSHPVTVNASLNPATGVITWVMTSTDPVSGQLTEDPLAGFLPPNNAQQQGEGFVTFTARPVSTTADATAIHNQAVVVFDTNAAINTPTAVNTIDAAAPASTVASLPAISQPTFTVSWSGQDGSGSGLAGYNVYVSDNGAPYGALLTGTTQTSTSFTGLSGHTYRFYSVAYDNVGNIQPTPTLFQASTTVFAPVHFTSGPSATFVAGQPASDTITTTSAPAPAFSTAGLLPAGVSLTDNQDGTATLHGTPALTTGVYTFNVIANNGYTPAVTQVFTLTVIDPPTISLIAPAPFTVGKLGTVNISSTAGLPTATTLTATGVPAGLTFTDKHNGTATITGTPLSAISGAHSITITASNGPGSQTTQTFTLTINLAPAITSPVAATFVVGQTSSFTVTTTGFPAATLSATVPNGLTFTDHHNGTATISGAPTVTPSATPINVTITASNAAGTIMQVLKLSVLQAPTLSMPASPTFTVGTPITPITTFTITTTAGVPSKTTLSISPKLPTGLVFTDKGNGTATITGTPALNTGGTTQYTLTASNAIGSQTTQPLTITIDQKPAITSATAATFDVGQTSSFTITTSGFPAATLSATVPNGLTFTDHHNGTATISGAPTVAPSATPISVTITASNAAGTITQVLKLSVLQAPTLSVPASPTFTVGTAIMTPFTITTIAGVPTKTTLSISPKLPTGLVFTDKGNGTATITGTPAVNTSGTTQYTLTASNAIGSQTTQPLTITIDQKPAITSAAAATFVVGQSGSFTIATTGFPAPSLTATVLPAGLTFTDNHNGTATIGGIPQALTANSYNITLTASNGVGIAFTQVFKLTVNQPPAITSPNSATFFLNPTGSQADTFSITTSAFPIATSIMTSALPTGVSLAVNTTTGTATLSGKPKAAGNFFFTITVHNGVLPDAVQMFELTVM